MTDAFSEASNIAETDYDVTWGHHHRPSPVVKGKHTVQPTTQLQATLRFLKKKASWLITLHHANRNRSQKTTRGQRSYILGSNCW